MFTVTTKKSADQRIEVDPVWQGFSISLANLTIQPWQKRTMKKEHAAQPAQISFLCGQITSCLGLPTVPGRVTQKRRAGGSGRELSENPSCKGHPD